MQLSYSLLIDLPMYHPPVSPMYTHLEGVPVNNPILLSCIVRCDLTVMDAVMPPFYFQSQSFSLMRTAEGGRAEKRGLWVENGHILKQCACLVDEGCAKKHRFISLCHILAALLFLLVSSILRFSFPVGMF